MADPWGSRWGQRARGRCLFPSGWLGWGREEGQFLGQLPCFGREWKHQGALGTVESKQHPMLKHFSGVTPGKPQSFLFWTVIREHWQGAGERALVNLSPHGTPPALGGTFGPFPGSSGHTGKPQSLILPRFQLCNVLRNKQGFAEIISLKKKKGRKRLQEIWQMVDLGKSQEER